MANDSSGNAARETVTVTYRDATSPAVLSTFPFPSECIRFETSSAIRVGFSEAMDPASITTSTLWLTDDLNNRVSGSVAYADWVATITPTSDLQASTSYTVTVSRGVKDIAGNALAADYSWTFTTGVSASVAPPTAYVSAATGNDTNAGTLISPFKTITAALRRAATGTAVQVMPGTYDAANGEIFPIVVPNGVSLIGNETVKGDPWGACQVLVMGAGMFAGLSNWAAAIEPTNGSTVAGLTIESGMMSLVTVSGLALRDTGVTVRNNTIRNSEIGIVLWYGSGGNTIVGNSFEGIWATPIYDLTAL
jgi:parallel beta-helix repeat protein